MKSLLITKYLLLLMSMFLNLSQNESNIHNNYKEEITSNIISETPKKINGITIVAPPKPIDQNAFDRVKETENNWVAFVPYGFGRKDDTSVRFNLEKQWWGEKSIGIESCIQNAHKVGFKVMLKPQIFIWNGWVGDINFDTPLQWENWEKEYRNFIMTFVHIASKHRVEMFCIGTELNISVVSREKFWRQLIKDIRKIYKGKLVYSANWDHYDEVKIWDDLDYIGLSSYFPLSESANPKPNLLEKQWQPITQKLGKFSRKHNKKILFTEYGYMSVDGCAGKAWEIEKNKDNLAINQKAQANALHTLLKVWSAQDFWAGGFLWKWFPDGMGHEGYPEKDYTPQDKEAENILKHWFVKI